MDLSPEGRRLVIQYSMLIIPLVTAINQLTNKILRTPKNPQPLFARGVALSRLPSRQSGR